MQRLLAVLLTVAAVLWAAAVLFVPARVRHAGSPVLIATIYTAGGLVCHQRPDRSFHVNGTRLPVCARCTGLYLSGALGAVVGWFGLSAIPRRARALLIAAVLPTAATVAAEWAGLAAPGNLTRAIAALPLGAAAGWVFVRLLRAEGAQQMRYDPLPYGHQVDRRREGASRF
jgi:uncharacterized membrane protein